MAPPPSASQPVPEVRDLRFDLTDVPRHWHGGRASVTRFFDNLSILFPPGERFFVSAVKAHLSQVSDPALHEAMAAFCAQEGHHSREHVRYNKLLRDQGLPVADMERRVERLLAVVTKISSRRRQLAVTCALEHFTALMATLVLTLPRSIDGAHPTMAALWRWHAAEENEHKSVAFDAYVATGGSWSLRCRVMGVVTLTFWLRVWTQQLRLMHADGLLFSAKEWAALAHFLFEPGGLVSLWRPYLAYYRRGFHPSQLDDAGMLEGWKRELGASDEYRKAQRYTVSM